MGAQAHNFVRLLITLIAIGGAMLSPFASAQTDSIVVATDKGPVVGVRGETMNKFLGIPYAKPPVGNLRWQPPQPVARWHGLRDATQFASHCPQGASPFGLPSDTEDCLYLNVYAPNHKGERQDAPHKHPVMVWIHGGALFLGESDDYNPIKLVQNEDVVVVTINYRLGFLGFLAHPALTAESGGSGNYGLMDQQAALAWVQRNIRHFGGDPNNVTIFGESAGGLSVHSHLASPKSAGLFHKAIIQSGAYALDQPTQAVADAGGAARMATLGCADPTDAACLRALPVETLLANQGSAGFVPNIDGNVLTQSIRSALASGQFNKVPVLQGSTHDEWRLFVALQNEFVSGPMTAAQYPTVIANFLQVPPAQAAFFANVLYPLAAYSSPSVAFGALGTDVVFACGARTSNRLLSQHVSTYAYEFNDPNPPQLFLPPVSFPYGAYHASEIQYVLGVRPNVPAPAMTADQAGLSDIMVSYWGRFAKNGNPNSRHTPDWAPYSVATDTVQSLVPPNPVPKTDFAVDHKCAVWAPGT